MSHYLKGNMDLGQNQISFLSIIFIGTGYNQSQTECWVNAGIFSHIQVANNPLICNCHDCFIHQAALDSCSQAFFGDATCTVNDNTNEVNFLKYFKQHDLNIFYCPVTGNKCPEECICKIHPCQSTISVKCDNGTASLWHTEPCEKPKDFFFNITIQHGNMEVLQDRPYLNKTRTMRITHSHLKSVQPEALEKLRISAELLDLSDNDLKNIPDQSEHDWPKLEKLVLHSNPWHCDCNQEWMKYWIRKHFNRKEAKATLCNQPSYHYSNAIAHIPDHMFICWYEIFIGVVIIIILFFMTLFGVLFWKRRFWIYMKYGIHPFERDECFNENKQADVFISYSNHDDEWSRDLMKQLKARGYKLCCHEEDFMAGVSIAANVDQGVHTSNRTVCIVSILMHQG